MDTLSNKLVWFPHQTYGFSIGRLVDISAQEASVLPVAYPSQTSVRYDLFNNELNEDVSNANSIEFKYASIFPFDTLTINQLENGNYKPESLSDVDDNCALVTMNEATLLDNIRLRFMRNKIYTYVANILIAVNPYAQIEGLHSERALLDYQGKSLGALPPHVYAIGKFN